MSVKKLSKSLAARRKETERLNNLPIRFELRWFKKGEKAGRDSQLFYVTDPSRKAELKERAEEGLRTNNLSKFTMKTWRATGRHQGYNDALYYDAWVIVPIREPVENELGPIHP